METDINFIFYEIALKSSLLVISPKIKLIFLSIFSKKVNFQFFLLFVKPITLAPFLTNFFDKFEPTNPARLLCHFYFAKSFFFSFDKFI